MSPRLLPEDFDSLLENAIEHFWRARLSGSAAQAGTRGGVIAGKNMDGFLEVVKSIARHCGMPDEAIFVSGRSDLTLPGYYRPNKNWDVVIVHRRRLIAALEFKSQVGAFGNNFNNRSEEAIGNAADLWAAATHGAYHPSNHKQFEGGEEPDPRPPFLGYLMLLQDCEKSTKPVRADSPHYHLCPEFHDASYAGRYQILCERLMKQGLYGAASLMLSPMPVEATPVASSSLSEATDVRNLFTQLAARLLAAVQT